ncbi:hypothetical protein DYI41_04955 [Marinobacter salarius]|nr:hypothetical protein [Marinobacter salarius]
MNTSFIETTKKWGKMRSQVEACCHSLVDISTARWLINDTGATELNLRNSETYVFRECGITRRE